MGALKTLSIILIILIFLSMIVLYIWGGSLFKDSKFFTTKMDELRFWKYKEEKTEPIKQRLMIKAEDSTSKFYLDAEYILNGNTGKLHNDVWEELELRANRTYEVKAVKEGYYYGKKDCFVEIEKESQCIIQLDPHGKLSMDVAKVSDENFLIRIELKDGFIREPMLCTYFKYTSNIIDTKINLEELARNQQPHEIQYKFDHCYLIEKNIESIREPPLSSGRVIKEIKNFLENCKEHEYTLNKSETADAIRYPCKQKISREKLIGELKSFYKFCYHLANETQRDISNSIISFYERCELKDEKELIEKMELNISYSKEPDDDDYVKFLIIDLGDYIENNEVIESYFGTDKKDEGMENYEYILKVKDD